MKKSEPKDLRYHLDIEREESYSCRESGCDREGICRCCRFSNVHIENTVNQQINFANAYDLYLHRETSDVDIYDVLDLHYLKHFFDPHDFEITYSHGYYGDEIDEVTWNNPVDPLSIHMYRNMFNPKAKVEELLRREYGETLELVKKFNDWELALVDSNKVRPSAKRVNTEKVNQYKQAITVGYNKRIFAPICNPVSREYSIIDGNHRFTAMVEGYATIGGKVWIIRPC